MKRLLADSFPNAEERADWLIAHGFHRQADFAVEAYFELDDLHDADAEVLQLPLPAPIDAELPPIEDMSEAERAAVLTYERECLAIRRQNLEMRFNARRRLVGSRPVESAASISSDVLRDESGIALPRVRSNYLPKSL